MSEALEKWSVDLIRAVVPNMLHIIEMIDAHLMDDLHMRGVPQERIDRMHIVDCGTVHMARLAAYVSSYINGVAQIHSELLKTSVLADWYAVFPERFLNMTNGITQRRWLGLCNPDLCEMLVEKIGGGFITDLSRSQGSAPISIRIRSRASARSSSI